MDISDGRIKFSFTAKDSWEDKRGDTLIVKESSGSYVKLLPVPEDAEAATGKVAIAGDRVRIDFKQKTSKKL